MTEVKATTSRRVFKLQGTYDPVRLLSRKNGRRYNNGAHLDGTTMGRQRVELA